MSDEIKVNNIEKSEGIAIGDGARVDINKTYVLSAYRPDAVHNLPPPNPHFVGRTEQLEQIAQNFANAANPLVVTQAIAGLGGVGKTQLALAYAHTRRAQYNMLWLLRASDVPTLDNELRLLGEALGLPVRGQDAEAIRTLVLSHLSSSQKQWLLLYDNVDELTPRDLRPYLPGGGHLLITSRRAAAHWQTFGQTLALDTFTEAEAVKFWQERELPAAPELAELAKELGQLPLAMEQAAAFMQVQQLPAAEYLSWFREARESLWAEEEPPTDYPKTVAATWQIGFDHARQRKGAADLLNLCCFLDPDGIPLDLVKQVTTLDPPVGARRDAPLQIATLQEVVGDERQLRLALTALRDYSLLQVEDDMITLHRLVQTVARDRMGQERERAWVELAVDLLVKAYPYDPRKVETWAAAGDLLPHFMTVTYFAHIYNCKTENTAHLNHETGYFVQSRGNYATAKLFYERALAIFEELLGTAHPFTTTILNNLGSLLHAMGNLDKARSHLERALSAKEKLLGSEHPETGAAIANLGSLIQDMGKLDEAKPYFERAVGIFKKAPEPNHSNLAIGLTNLGGLLHKMGELASARAYYEEALTIKMIIFGPRHPSTAQSLNNLGGLMYDLNDLASAKLYLEQALSIREQTLPPAHPKLAESLNNLGGLLKDFGEWTKALQYYKRALIIREKVLGPDHPDTANSLNNLGNLLHSSGKPDEAVPYFERAYKIRLAALGDAHPDTASSIWWLGVIAEGAGNVEEARSSYTQAHAIYNRALGANHPTTQQVLSFLNRLNS